jgi:hypothetical protein
VKICLLDSSFLIDLLNEIAAGDAGSAHEWLRRNAAAELWISPVTLAEVLEGARDPTPSRTICAATLGKESIGCMLIKSRRSSGAQCAVWVKMMRGRLHSQTIWARSWWAMILGLFGV